MENSQAKTIIANWKSNKTLDEALQWLDDVSEEVRSAQHTIILFPPFPFIAPLSKKISQLKLPIQLGVQTLSPFPAGAYTGAVTARNLEGLNVKYALLGHSERRKYFHETSQEVANAALLALENNMTPVVCVHHQIIWTQANALEDTVRKQGMVLFETPENIGTGTMQPLEEVLQNFAEIRKAFGKNAKIIYGGSVGMHQSPAEYLRHPEIDGIVAGTASLDPASFVTLWK